MTCDKTWVWILSWILSRKNNSYKNVNKHLKLHWKQFRKKTGVGRARFSLLFLTTGDTLSVHPSDTFIISKTLCAAAYKRIRWNIRTLTIRQTPSIKIFFWVATCWTEQFWRHKFCNHGNNRKTLMRCISVIKRQK